MAVLADTHLRSDDLDRLPGSATQRRAPPRCTFGMLELAGGRVLRRAIVPT